MSRVDSLKHERLERLNDACPNAFLPVKGKSAYVDHTHKHTHARTLVNPIMPHSPGLILRNEVWMQQKGASMDLETEIIEANLIKMIS